MEPSNERHSNLKRFRDSAGITGVAALFLVYWAASLGERFDFTVFFLSLSALTICWWRTWILMPDYYHDKNAERDMWNRYFGGDWKHVALISGLTGDELDQLRGLFERAENQKIRDYLRERAPAYSSIEVNEFIRYFNDDWPIYPTTYIDDSGRIQRFD
ncbi:MAG: hypothetical protein KUG69_04030 [Marinosulfonomonas sp.]|nr:hypothetical protein [Marinosulfonomonas sp.]